MEVKTVFGAWNKIVKKVGTNIEYLAFKRRLKIAKAENGVHS